jgi:hypothetical protein
MVLSWHGGLKPEPGMGSAGAAMERVVDRRIRPHPFALGQVIGAAVVGTATGLFLNLVAVVVFSAGLAAGAAVSAIVCRWRPGFGAAGWKLWIVGSLANPVVLAGAAFSASEYECLLGWKTGWDCLFADIGPFVTGLGLLPPLAGLLARWWAGRAAKAKM